MAWCDRTSFETIKEKTGLSKADVIVLMRRHLKPKSFRLWRARVSGRGTKGSSESNCNHLTGSFARWQRCSSVTDLDLLHRRALPANKIPASSCHIYFLPSLKHRKRLRSQREEHQLSRLHD